MAQTDPIFIAHARTAAREDLRAYLGHGSRKLAAYELPERTLEVLGEMHAFAGQLEHRSGTPADTKRAWRLIDAFKSSIPGWAGRCNGSGTGYAPSFVDEHISRATLLQLRRELKRTPLERRPFRRVQLVATVRAEKQAASQAAEETHRFRVPMRETALSIEEASAQIHAAAAPFLTAAPPARKSAARTPAAAGIPCPSCSTPLAVVSPTSFRCAECATSWELKPKTPATRATAPRQMNTERPAVDWRAAGLKAAETRRRRQLEAARAAEGTVAA